VTCKCGWFYDTRDQFQSMYQGSSLVPVPHSVELAISGQSTQVNDVLVKDR
jgi:hypothetical protein